MHILDMPAEINVEVFKHLSPNERLVAARTCQDWSSYRQSTVKKDIVDGEILGEYIIHKLKRHLDEVSMIPEKELSGHAHIHKFSGAISLDGPFEITGTVEYAGATCVSTVTGTMDGACPKHVTMKMVKPAASVVGQPQGKPLERYVIMLGQNEPVFQELLMSLPKHKHFEVTTQNIKYGYFVVELKEDAMVLDGPFNISGHVDATGKSWITYGSFVNGSLAGYYITPVTSGASTMDLVFATYSLNNRILSTLDISEFERDYSEIEEVDEEPQEQDVTVETATMEVDEITNAMFRALMNIN